MSELFDLFGQCVGADPQVVGLSGRVYFGKDDMVRQSESPGKFVHQGLSPGVGVGLEHAPEVPVGIVLRGTERCLDLCGMMRVVVDDGKAVSGAQNLEASFRTNIFTQRSRCVCAVDAEAVSRCGSRHGIVDVVLAGDAQRDSLPVDSSVRAAGAERVRRVRIFVVGDVLGPVICLVVGAVQYDVAGKSVTDLLIIGNLRVDDQGAVFGDQLLKERRMSSRSLKKSR